MPLVYDALVFLGYPVGPHPVGAIWHRPDVADGAFAAAGGVSVILLFIPVVMHGVLLHGHEVAAGFSTNETC